MIRPSPTSLSLSAQDISHHLQDIDIYLGLLKQGFEKKDILRYRRQQRDTITRGSNDLYSGKPLRVPLYTEIVVHKEDRDEYPTQDLSTFYSSDRDAKQDSGGHLNVERSSNAKAIKLSQSLEPRLSSGLAGKPTSPVSPHKQRVDSNVSTNSHHAPRKTSLLRFSSNISLNDRSSADVHSKVLPLPQWQMEYGEEPQRHAYSRSSTDNDGSNNSSLTAVFRDLAIDESLVPVRTPDLTRYAARDDGKEIVLSGDSLTTGVEREELYLDIEFSVDARPKMYSADVSRIVPSLQAWNLEASSSRVEDLPSSTPILARRSSPDEEPPSQVSPPLPAIPRTPASFAHRPSARTEPRHSRFRYLDGPSFTPYNDSIPADLQPQTPADIARQPLVDEMSASYTAPPGRLRNDLTPTQLGGSIEAETGQDSPTNRAINMRRRRNREFARSARVEGLRISRTRRRLQPQGSSEDGVGRTNVLGDIDEQLNMWRDDLDADRVGEENFEEIDRLTEMTGAGMRVVSGNRHVNEN